LLLFQKIVEVGKNISCVGLTLLRRKTITSKFSSSEIICYVIYEQRI